MLAAFHAAYETGDLAGPVRLLHPDAVYVTDGGGKIAAARKLIQGGLRVAEVMVRVGRQWRPDRIDVVEVDGELALQPGKTFASLSCHTSVGHLVSLMRAQGQKDQGDLQLSATNPAATAPEPCMAPVPGAFHPEPPTVNAG